MEGFAGPVVGLLWVLWFLLAFGCCIWYWVNLYCLWQQVLSWSKSLGLRPSVASAGQAVGLAFVPFLNFYWIFRTFGMGRDLNAIRGATSANVPACSTWKWVTACVLILLSLVAACVLLGPVMAYQVENYPDRVINVVLIQMAFGILAWSAFLLHMIQVQRTFRALRSHFSQGVPGA